MAFRWRTWDFEEHDSELTITPITNYNDSELVTAVGKDRDYSELRKISICSVVLPKAAFIPKDGDDSNPSTQCGRGRSLKNRALSYDKPGRRPGERDQVANGTRLGPKFLGSEDLYDASFPGLNQSNVTATSVVQNKSSLSQPSGPSIDFAKIVTKTNFANQFSGPQDKTGLSNNLTRLSGNSHGSVRSSLQIDRHQLAKPSHQLAKPLHQLAKPLHQLAKPSCKTSIPIQSGWPQFKDKTDFTKKQSSISGNSQLGGHMSSNPIVKTALSSTTMPSKPSFRNIYLTRNPPVNVNSTSPSISRSSIKDEEKKSKETAPNRPLLKSTTMMTKDNLNKDKNVNSTQSKSTHCVFKDSVKSLKSNRTTKPLDNRNAGMKALINSQLCPGEITVPENKCYEAIKQLDVNGQSKLVQDVSVSNASKPTIPQNSYEAPKLPVCTVTEASKQLQVKDQSKLVQDESVTNTSALSTPQNCYQPSKFAIQLDVKDQPKLVQDESVANNFKPSIPQNCYQPSKLAIQLDVKDQPKLVQDESVGNTFKPSLPQNCYQPLELSICTVAEASKQLDKDQSKLVQDESVTNTSTPSIPQDSYKPPELPTCIVNATKASNITELNTTISNYVRNTYEHIKNDRMAADNHNPRKLSIGASESTKPPTVSDEPIKPLKTFEYSPSDNNDCNNDHLGLMIPDNFDSIETLTVDAFSSETNRVDSVSSKIQPSGNYGEPSEPLLDYVASTSLNNEAPLSDPSGQPDASNIDVVRDADHTRPSEEDNAFGKSQILTEIDIYSDTEGCRKVPSVDHQEPSQVSHTNFPDPIITDDSNLLLVGNPDAITNNNDHQVIQPPPLLGSCDSAKVPYKDDLSTNGSVIDEPSILVSVNSDSDDDANNLNIDKQPSILLNRLNGDDTKGLERDNDEPTQFNKKDDLKASYNDVDEQVVQSLAKSSNNNGIISLNNHELIEQLTDKVINPPTNVNTLNQLPEKPGGDTLITFEVNIPYPSNTDHQSTIEQDNSTVICDMVPLTNDYSHNLSEITGASSFAITGYTEPSITIKSNSETTDDKKKYGQEFPANLEDEFETETTYGEPCNVKLENLPPTITEEGVLEMIEPYGKVITCTFILEESESKTCIVRMADSVCGEWIVVSLDGLEIDGHRMQTKLDV